jgi:ribonuclease P protein component
VFLEEDVSAPQPKTPEGARVPDSDENCRRTKSAEPTSREGPEAAHSLTPPTHARRLRSKKDFQVLYREGTVIRGDLMVLICNGSDGTGVRTAVVASRKVGGAVARNRAKRLLREAFRLEVESRQIGPLDIVLIARRACAEAGIRDVRHELVTLVDRASSVIKPHLAGQQQQDEAPRTDDPPQNLITRTSFGGQGES